LEQVLVNLYLNAVDVIPEGGKLMMEAKIEQSDGTAPVAIITVADTGFGIAETDLPKIFQPFFTGQEEKRNRVRTSHLSTNRQESRRVDRSRKPSWPGHLFQNPLAPGAYTAQ
jgi:hypothetical protein